MTSATAAATAQFHIPGAASFSSRNPTYFSPTSLPLGRSLIKKNPAGLTITSPRFNFATEAKPNPTQEQKWTHEGSVTESLPNGMFRVQLDNQDLIIGYISGKIRKNYVRILPGDRVRVEVSRYDSSRGRIIYRLRNRDPIGG
ncbi:Translation initiation factor IF-1 chloroplastic [Euphorbia peplus]|nr:Translation initiation factor IF-1 chloroplastic [Euphorbia peplus]